MKIKTNIYIFCKVSVTVKIDSLDIRGLYTLISWLSKSDGNFTVKLTGVNVEGVARLEVATDGKLQAQDIDMDLTFDKIDLDFTNLGFLGKSGEGEETIDSRYRR